LGKSISFASVSARNHYCLKVVIANHATYDQEIQPWLPYSGTVIPRAVVPEKRLLFHQNCVASPKV